MGERSGLAPPRVPSPPAICLRGLGRYIACWLGAFSRTGRRAAPLSPRRLTALLLGGPAFLLLQLLHLLGLVADEFLFRGYRRVAVREPLFVLGIPRSGTTFAHRTLAGALPDATTFTTWEAVLAPSVAERYAVRAASALDRALGGYGRRAIERVVGRAGAGVAAVHEVGLAAPEEDYLALLPAGGCFLAALALPHAERLWRLGDLDRRAPEDEKRRLLGFYRACLQKHLHFHGPGSRLVSKNAAFASWLAPLREAFPDARWLVCVREPVGALSSQLSALRPAARAFGLARPGELLTRRFPALFERWYAELDSRLAQSRCPRTALIAAADLRRAPGAVLRAALRRLGWRRAPLAAGADGEAAAAAAAGGGTHAHDPGDFGLDPEAIRARVGLAHARILRSAVRVGAEKRPVASGEPVGGPA